MAMSDCPKCWETPCSCGYEYKNWTTERIEKQIDVLKDVLEKRKKPGMGLYRVWWKDGGNSLAAIGQNASGRLWFAPTNWITGSTFLDEHMSSIERWDLIVEHGN